MAAVAAEADLEEVAEAVASAAEVEEVASAEALADITDRPTITIIITAFSSGREEGITAMATVADALAVFWE